jgi:hypothetical protein
MSSPSSMSSGTDRVATRAEQSSTGLEGRKEDQGCFIVFLEHYFFARVFPSIHMSQKARRNASRGLTEAKRMKTGLLLSKRVRTNRAVLPKKLTYYKMVAVSLRTRQFELSPRCHPRPSYG